MERLAGLDFYDPFAPEDFNAATSFDALFTRYEQDAVEHDDSADRFVAETEALLLDAQFAGQFVAIENIALRMHELCNDDHMLAASMQTSEFFNPIDREHEGHDHDVPKEKAVEAKKGKKKTLRPGWLQLLLQQYDKQRAK